MPAGEGQGNSALTLDVDSAVEGGNTREENPDDATMTDAASPPTATASPLLSEFNLFGWRPSTSLSDDENYMDAVLLITRNSICDWQGHMGSLMVDTRLMPAPSSGEAETLEDLERRLHGCIIGAATNKPLFNPKDSDIHAEITALGMACKNCHSTEGATAYITMPPCKRCFAALVTFGVRRIVSRKLPPEQIRTTAERNGIEIIDLSPEARRTQMERINGLTNATRTDEELMRIAEDRKKRKKQKRGSSEMEGGDGNRDVGNKGENKGGTNMGG